MAVSYSIDAGASLVRYVVEGDLTIADFLKAFDDALSDPAFRPGCNALVDVRRGSLLPVTSAGVDRTAAHVLSSMESRGRDYRAALVVASEVDFGVCRMYQAYGDHLPCEVLVFKDYEAALSWLANGTAAPSPK